MNRNQLLAALVSLPACAVAVVGLWALTANRAGGWVWPPDTVNMAEAVATGDYAEVTRQLEHGVDPNPAMDVRARLLQSKPMRVTPLQAAVWARTPRMVTILLEGGAILSPTSLAVLKCMNDDNRNSEVRALLDAVVTEGELPCAGLNVPRP